MTLYKAAHIGFLVKDLDASITRVSSVLGVTFPDPVVSSPPVFIDEGTTTKLDLRLTWSHEGPPHIELIEAQPSGLYSLKGGEGFHHLGVWEDDFSSLRRNMELWELSEQAAQQEQDGETIANYTSPADLYGMRLEFVSTARKAEILEWLKVPGWHR
jgi:catechol 2,3-dioxygenase-like lactoylglutathione lyase family enzyme